MARSATRKASSEIRCLECGRAISPNLAFCPFCHAAILRRYCPGCHKLVPDHVHQCPYCGSSAGEKPRHRSPYPGIIAVVLLAMVFAAALWWIDSDKKRSSGNPSSDSRPQPRATPAQPDPASNSVPVKEKPSPSPTKAAPATPAAPVVKNEEEGIRLNLEGHGLIKQGKYEEAIPILRRAVGSFPEGSQNPGYFYAQYNLAHSLRRTGKVKEAIPLLEKCVAFDRTNQLFADELDRARVDAPPP